MGNATLYWYPLDGGTLQVDDLGEGFSMVEHFPIRRIVHAESLDGTHFFSGMGGGLKVRLRMEDIPLFDAAGQALYRQLYRVTNHLERGGRIGAAADAVKTFAAWAYSPPKRGDTTLRTKPSTWWTAGTITEVTAGDELVVESMLPELSREEVKVQTTAAPPIALAAGLVLQPSADVLVRHRDYYPLLLWPEEERRDPFSYRDGRVAATWDITLHMDYGGIAAVADTTLNLSTTASAAGISLPDVLRKNTVSSKTSKRFATPAAPGPSANVSRKP